MKYENLVVNSMKVIKETLLQKYTEEKPLLKSTELRRKLTENVGVALASFSDVMYLLFFSTEATDISYTLFRLWKC